MKDMPWMDIYPKAQWDEVCQRFKEGTIKSKAIGAGRKLSSFFGRAYSSGQKGRYSRKSGLSLRLPKELAELQRKVDAYHSMDKRDPNNLTPRANALRGIAAVAERYLVRFNAKKKVIAKSRQEHEAYKQSMEYAVAKLHRRALRKAGYIEQLEAHCRADDKELNNPIKLLEYIRRNREERDDQLLALAPGVRLERLDPWHRASELNVRFDEHADRILIGGSNYLMDVAFSTWVREVESGDDIVATPFFIWLEGHFVCTGVPDKESKQFIKLAQANLPYAIDDDERQMFIDGIKGRARRVIYEHADDAVKQFNKDMVWVPSDEMFLLSFDGGTCKAFRIGDIVADDDADRGKRPFDTADAVRSKEPGAYAYVWGKTGEVFCARHEPSRFHHSSFVSGEKVQCAGMIKVKNGKVKLVSSNSGHYQPTPWHLRRFVQHLASKNVFAANAVVKVGYVHADGGFREDSMPVDAFLKSPIGMLKGQEKKAVVAKSAPRKGQQKPGPGRVAARSSPRRAGKKDKLT